MLLCLLAPTQTTPAAPQAARLEVHSNRDRIQAGEVVEIFWTAVGSTDVLMEPSGERMPTSGRMVVRPETTTTYWLSAMNDIGGETRPLTIYVAGGPDLPNPGAQPVPGPVFAPVSAPIAVPVPISRFESGDQAWIQVVALTNRANADRLVEELSQRCGERPVIQEVPDPKGKVESLLRVRFGPFPSVRDAKIHLKSLSPKLKGTGSTPFVTVH